MRAQRLSHRCFMGLCCLAAMLAAASVRIESVDARMPALAATMPPSSQDPRRQPLTVRQQAEGPSFFFPQIGDGSEGGIRFRTRLVLVNTGFEEVEVLLEFFDSAGEPLSLQLGEAPEASSLTVALGAGQAFAEETPASGRLKVGYARVSLPAEAEVGGTAVFTRLEQASGIVLYQSGVAAARPLDSFSILLDSRGVRDSGLALVNASSEEDREANLTLRLYDTELNLIASQEVLLAPRSHLARFVNELFPDIEQAGEMLGLVTVESDQPVAALTLLQEDNPLLEFPDEVPTLAGFPVIEGRADQPAAMPEGIPVGPSQVIYFPQIGDGISGDIRFQSNLYLANTGGESLVRLELFDSQGKPLELELSQLGSASQFEFVMARGEVISALSAGLGELAVGYARLEAAQGVGGVSVFSRSDIPSGKLVSQAGVPAVQPLDSFTIFWDTSGVRNTGLALVNPPLGAASPLGQFAEADIGLRLYDKEFRLLDGIGASLAPGQHLPRFVNELFERSLEELQGRQGVLTVDSDAPLAAVTLLQDDDPELDFPDKVPTLTAFPVLPVSSGRQQLGTSDLSISKSVTPSGVVSVGQELTYTLSVFNAGPAEAISVRVRDELPAGVTFLSASGPGFSCSQESRTVTCTRPSLAPGAAAQIQIIVAAPSQPGTILNSALIDSLNPIVDPTDSEDEVTNEVVPASANLSVEKAASKQTVSVGEWLDYSLTVRNAGPDTAHSVEVVDTLPPGAVFRGFSGTGWSCPPPQAVADGAPLACRLSQLEAESSAQLVLTVSAPGEPGSAVNSASASSPAQDERPQDNTDQESIEVNPASADLSIEKDASREEVSVGDEFDFILTVRNEGPDNAHSVSLRDFLPDTLALKGASPSDWMCSPRPPSNPPAGTLECILDSLPAGASAELRLRVEPTQEGSLTNAASVSSPASDGNEENDQADRTVVARACDLLININAPLSVYVGNDGSARLEYQILALNRSTLAPTDALLAARALLKPPGADTFRDALELEEGVLPGNSALCSNAVPAVEFDCPVSLQPSQKIAIALETEIPRSAFGGQVELLAMAQGPGCPAGLSSAEVIAIESLPGSTPTLSKEGPQTAREGTSLDYHLEIDRNAHVVVTDQVPAGLVYQGSLSPGWDCELIETADPGVPGCPCVRCQATDPAASDLDLRFFVPADYCQRFSGDQQCGVINVAGLSFFGDPVASVATFTGILSDGGPNGEDCELGLSLRSEPFLVIDSDGSNGELLFELEITNHSDQTVSGPELKLGLDRMLELQEAAAGQAKCTGDNIPANPFECKLSADIAPGGKMTLSFETEVPPSLFGQTINAHGSVTALGTSCAVDGGGGGNQVNEDTEVTPDGNVTPRKQGPSPVAVGDTLKYELSINNDTGLKVKRATLIDEWPMGVLYQGFEGEGWDCTDSAEWELNQDVECQFNEELADNQTSPPLFLRALVPDGFCDGRAGDCEFVNVASVPHFGGADDVTTQVTSTSSDLEVEIVVNDTTLDIGNDGSNNQLVYQVEVTNQGSSPASAVTVISDLTASGGQPLDPSPRLEIQESVFVGQPRKCVGNNAARVPFECPLQAEVPAGKSVKVSFETEVPTSLFGGRIEVRAEALAGDGATAMAPPRDIDILPDPPSLRLEKSAPDVVSEGGILTYTLVLQNEQRGVAEGVKVLDEAPPGLDFRSGGSSDSVWTCSGAPAITCQARPGEGLVGNDVIIELEFLVPAGFCQERAECEVFNQAKAIHRLTDQFAFSNQVMTRVERVLKADLSLTKSDSADPVQPGQGFSYTLAVSNAGPDEAEFVTVTDNLPAGLGFVGASGAGWDCSQAGGLLTCTRPSLASGADAPLTVDVTAPAQPGTLNNSASVSSQTEDPNPANNSDSESTQVSSNRSELEVRILAPDALDIGNDGSDGQLVYQVEVINRGSAPASPLKLISELMAFAGQPADPSPILELREFVGQGQSPRCEGSNISKVRFECPLLQEVPAQGSVKVSFEAQVPTSLFGGEINVKAEALAPDGTLLTASPENIDVLPDPPLLRVSKSAPTDVPEGETLTYQIILENEQAGVAEQVLVLDAAPGGLLFQTSRGAGWTCSGLQDRPDCSSKCIACTRTQGEGLFGQAPAIELDFLVPVGFCQEVALGEECIVANLAKAIHRLTDEFAFSNPVETTVTRQEDIPGEADLSIAKSDSADPVEAGQGFSYTLAVSSVGPGPAESVTVTDTLPTGLAFVGASGQGWDCTQSGGVLTCIRPSLAVGAAPTITVDVTAPAQPGTLLNSASVSSQTSDPDPEDNSDSESTQVEAAPEQQADLSLAKSDSADPVETGQAFSYTLAVSNAGPDAAESVTVTDTLPAGVGFVGASGAGWDCSQSGGVFTCTRPSLAVGAAPPIIVSVMAPGQPGTLVNSASASSQTDDPEPSGNSDSESTTVIPSNQPPECSAALAEPALLWPPNHQFVSVGVANVSDPDQDAVTLTILGVFQDEPVEGGGDGNTCSDATLNGNGTAQLRAERSQKGDGRVYHLEFEAADGKGGVCRRTIAVCVPSNRGSPSCVDQGPLFDSTRCPDGE